MWNFYVEEDRYFYGDNGTLHSDPRYPFFLNWVRDLFLFYWDKGKRT